MRYITHEGIKYRIRGPYTAPQLRELYKSFLAKANHQTKISFRGWLVGYGKVHSRVKQ